MNFEAKQAIPWDLSDPKTMRSSFVSRSFYVVIDGIHADAVQAAAKFIKEALTNADGTRVRGPLALKSERRRYMVLRDINAAGMYISRPIRIRNVLLVEHPSSIGISAMISLTIPRSVNVKIEPYEQQYELKERK
jgi:ribosomal protein S10